MIENAPSKSQAMVKDLLLLNKVTCLTKGSILIENIKNTVTICIIIIKRNNFNYLKKFSIYLLSYKF